MIGMRWRMGSALALGAALLLGGCAAAGPSAREASNADLKDGQVEWAFTQADQHPEKKLIEVIDGASETLDIAIYSLTYPDIVQAIKNAASRGVKVRIITDRIQSGGKTQKEALKLLGSAGIPLKINSHSGLMHLKMTVADGEVATTGSFNYSKSASTTNDEIFMAFRDAEIARSFSERFEAMWNDDKDFETLRASIAMPEEKTPSAPAGTGDGENDGETGDAGEGGGVGKSAAPASCKNPRIKGNINSKGDKIYHVPGGAQYERTKEEALFCTEEEAEAAGFRKAAS